LGLFEETSWKQGEARLNPGDVLLLYTDGVPEACNPSGEFMGLDRLIQCVDPLIQDSAEGIKTVIETKLNIFLSDQPPQDDLTLMVVKRSAGHDLLA
jgi:sigma-B regulation protein RsbU (phosphoserine phosphatase)